MLVSEVVNQGNVVVCLVFWKCLQLVCSMVHSHRTAFIAYQIYIMFASVSARFTGLHATQLQLCCMYVQYV